MRVCEPTYKTDSLQEEGIRVMVSAKRCNLFVYSSPGTLVGTIKSIRYCDEKRRRSLSTVLFTSRHHGYNVYHCACFIVAIVTTMIGFSFSIETRENRFLRALSVQSLNLRCPIMGRILMEYCVIYVEILNFTRRSYY